MLEEIDEIAVKMPDVTYEDTNLVNIGYESVSMIDNLETIYILILFVLALMIILVLMWIL